MSTQDLDYYVIINAGNKSLFSLFMGELADASFSMRMKLKFQIVFVKGDVK